MRIALVRTTLWSVACIWLAACSVPETAPDGPIVLAASSLEGPLDTIADGWASEGHARPVLVYAGTPALVRQIQSGVPADIIIAADQAWMDTLIEQGLVAPSVRTAIAANRLSLVWRRPLREDRDPRPATAGTEPLAPWLALAERIAIAEPETVPAGRYAKAALQSLGMWDAVFPKLVPTDNVRSALALVERREADAAIVYASDAKASDKIRVIGTLPADAHPPVRYPLAVLRDHTHADAGRFAEYLASPAGRAVFIRYGFDAP